MMPRQVGSAERAKNTYPILAGQIKMAKDLLLHIYALLVNYRDKLVSHSGDSFSSPQWQSNLLRGALRLSS
jgi:hypothetical protein